MRVEGQLPGGTCEEGQFRVRDYYLEYLRPRAKHTIIYNNAIVKSRLTIEILTRALVV